MLVVNAYYGFRGKWAPGVTLPKRFHAFFGDWENGKERRGGMRLLAFTGSDCHGILRRKEKKVQNCWVLKFIGDTGKGSPVPWKGTSSPQGKKNQSI